MMKKYQKTITVYELDGGFFVEVSKDEDEVMAILDYAIGFISDSKYKDCAEQAAEFVGLIEFDDDYEEE